MAYEAKTKELPDDPRGYLMSLTPARRREDALKLLDIFEQETGMPGVLWTGGGVGFGKYSYRYASGHSGEAALTGFAARKAAISLYTWLEGDEREEILGRLGKHRAAVGCVYVNKLADIDEGVLREMIRLAVKRMRALYPQQEG